MGGAAATMAATQEALGKATQEEVAATMAALTPEARAKIQKCLGKTATGECAAPPNAAVAMSVESCTTLENSSEKWKIVVESTGTYKVSIQGSKKTKEFTTNRSGTGQVGSAWPIALGGIGSAAFEVYTNVYYSDRYGGFDAESSSFNYVDFVASSEETFTLTVETDVAKDIYQIQLQEENLGKEVQAVWTVEESVPHTEGKRIASLGADVLGTKLSIAEIKEKCEAYSLDGESCIGFAHNHEDKNWYASTGFDPSTATYRGGFWKKKFSWYYCVRAEVEKKNYKFSGIQKFDSA